MADLTITEANIDWVSGPKSTHDAAETVTAGDWLYKATSTTVGVATNSDTNKDTVIGLSLNGGVTGQPITYAKDGCIVDFGSILTKATWYVLSASGATSPVADQTSNDWVALVGYGIDGTQMQIRIVNTGLQAP